MKNDIEITGCPFCTTIDFSRSYYKCWDENGWEGQRCDGCGLIYISPRPTKQYMKELYESGKNEGMTEHDHFNYHYSEYLFNKWILRKTRKHVKAHHPHILEIGVGGGMFLRQAEMEGFIGFGLEINETQTERLQNEFGLSIYNNLDLLPDYGFDVIFHKNVLSHLHDPIEIFKKCKDKLTKNGIMVFITGNGGDLSQKWLNRVGVLGYPEHLFLFSNKSLGLLIERSGFKPIRYYIIPKLRQLWNHIKKKRERSGFNGITEHTEFNFPFKDKIRGFFSYILNYRIGRLFPKKLPSNIISFLRKV